MAKREDKNNNNNFNLRRAVIRNWIICGVSLAAIIILYLWAK